MPLSTPCWHAQTRFAVTDEIDMNLRKRAKNLLNCGFWIVITHVIGIQTCYKRSVAVQRSSGDGWS